MTDKEKNQAVFTALCELADKYLGMMKDTEEIREATKQKPMLTYKDLTKKERMTSTPLYERAIIEYFDGKEPDETIIVGNFRCTFKPSYILDLMKHFGKPDKYTFTFQQDDGRDIIAKFSMDFESGAKRLADITPGKKEEVYDSYPLFRNILVEYDMVTGAVNLTSTETHLFAVITDDDESIAPNDHTKAMAMLPAEDWKRLCDAMRKNKCAVEFTLYERFIDQGEYFATLVAKAGDVIVRSIQPKGVRYPNWRLILPDKKQMRYYEIAEKDRKDAQKWVMYRSAFTTAQTASISIIARLCIMRGRLPSCAGLFRLS